MLISNFNKKILLLLYLIIFSGNVCAVEYLDKINDKIKFPTLKVLDSNEKPLMLIFNQDLKKKGYVINFWATWCVPCKKELPDLSLLKSKIKKYNIDVLTISIDKKNIKDQLEFLSNNGASNLDHLFDKEMKIFRALKLRGIPTTIIVDQNNFVISKHEGVLKWGEDEIINKIKNLFY
tara:strand:- start:461 stop:994 length:534 start_codon:yes stop_codon:yes gene_type:complete